MLSLANVKTVQAANYYAKDDYYSRSSSEGDAWQGRLWKQFGKSKALHPEAFQKALKSMPNPERAAIDLTFSAPKSVSIAMILSDTAKADMLAAHHQAVKDTLAEIEQSEIEARVTQNGVTERVRTGNMAAAKFHHFVSRNQDMQLHTHCVILNRTECNGKFYAISNENLYKNHILYGKLYRNRLARNLQNLGYWCRFTDTEKGFFELENVTQEAIDRFSTRRAEIVEKLKHWHADGAAAASRATLLTRKAKQTKDLSLLEKAWRAQIDEMGGLVLSKGERIRYSRGEARAAFERAIKRLSERQFAFSERELERAVLAEGCLLGLQRADFSALLKQASLLCLGKEKTDDETLYFTTEENCCVEAEIKANLQDASRLDPLTEARMKLAKLAREQGWRLSAEQTETVLHLVESKRQYVAVQGLAGTGKTYMLKAMRELYERSGWNVYGASFTGKAAEGLEQDAKIKSTTLHSFLNRMEKEAGNRSNGDTLLQKTWDFSGLNPGKKPEVWVIDEAGLTDNTLLVHLQRAARLRRAKVVLVGDYQQLALVGVGNAYSNFVQTGKIETCYLTDIRRQKNQALLEAVKASVSGDVKESLSLLSDKTTEIKSPLQRFRAIAKEYAALEANLQEKAIVLTAKNKDRLAINTEIRATLLRSGQIAAEEGREFKVSYGSKDQEEKRIFAPCERVIFTKNDHALGIMNGQIGTIQAIRGRFIIVNSNGKTVEIDSEQYRQLDYGYCVTSHKAQGITVEKAIVHIDSTQRNLNSRNAFYVNISRARSSVSLYTDNREKLAEQVGQWAKKLTSEDFLIQQSSRATKAVFAPQRSICAMPIKTIATGAKAALKAISRVLKQHTAESTMKERAHEQQRGIRM